MKILVLDIETSPHLAYVWGLFKENIPIERLVAEGRVMCWSAKWLGDKKIEAASEHHTGHEKMVRVMHSLLDEADVVVHYHGSKFDIPKLNREFIKYNLAPPSPYKQVDLLKVVRKHFKFPSYKLAYVLKALGLKQKVSSGGFENWKKCMEGNAEAWDVLLDYCVNDTLSEEELYLFLLPWIDNHPPHGLYKDQNHTCPNCGSDLLERRGYAYTRLGKYHRYQCRHCGSWSQGKKNVAAQEVIR